MLHQRGESDGLELDLSPIQGLWTDEQYLALTNQTNTLIEFTDGRIEVLPMPTKSHQLILILLFDLFRAVVGRKRRAGTPRAIQAAGTARGSSASRIS